MLFFGQNYEIVDMKIDLIAGEFKETLPPLKINTGAALCTITQDFMDTCAMVFQLRPEIKEVRFYNDNFTYVVTHASYKKTLAAKASQYKENYPD